MVEAKNERHDSLSRRKCPNIPRGDELSLKTR